jgi:hypothetical protein
MLSLSASRAAFSIVGGGRPAAGSTRFRRALGVEETSFAEGAQAGHDQILDQLPILDAVEHSGVQAFPFVLVRPMSSARRLHFHGGAEQSLDRPCFASTCWRFAKLMVDSVADCI